MAATNTGRYRAVKTTSKNEFGANKKDGETSDSRIKLAQENDSIDEKYGFHRVKDHSERTGFLINMHTNEILNDDKFLNSCVDYYFIEEDGKRFKISLPFQPYFYILVPRESIQEVSQFIKKKYEAIINKIEPIKKEDLDLPNHLIGLKQDYIKLSFINMNDLMKVRRDILLFVRKNKEKTKSNTYYLDLLTKELQNKEILDMKFASDPMEKIMDIREYDVPYHVRVSIDAKIFVGSWYTIKSYGGGLNVPTITKRDDLIERPDAIVLAFDIETTKLPLKFPDSATDQIMMISYMIDGQGYLITNREIISQDIENFEYTPKPEFEGMFTVFNEPDERRTIKKFFSHINEIKPHIFVTYNGDFFDWQFIETRAAVHQMDMKQEIGFSRSKEGVYSSRPAMHMDCLCWVKRDSYLPVGSQNLKAVAKAKLRYDPVELDPEDMCQLAADDPITLSNYSVSDAVATYYLYIKYVHPFIFALCTIIPMEPDEVLRKGSGTLCEALLMVEAFHVNIIFPNKQESELNKLTEDGHVLLSETYVGGHVEALESGVFRADIPCRFRLVPAAFDKLISQIDKTLVHAIEVEEGIPVNLVTNFEEVKKEIVDKLAALRDHPNRMENPIIYHLDVGAMYPNIILTNRLQPCAMVNEQICAACDFNRAGAQCQRNMSWMWRAEYLPASRNEYNRIQQQLETERFPPLFPNGEPRAFHSLPKEEQAELEKKRLTEYCRKAYKKTKITKMDEKVTTICQKENSFYVDTVRAFRDRRYEYKALNKKAKQSVSAAVASKDSAAIKSAKNREVLYDSLQLAHKCILNSFYGYVMRRGARWHSMEMAGIVCYTGAHIIMRAREIIEQVGRPLELDTDGIWCVLPASFPENVDVFTIHEKKKKLTISYPNAVLNAMVKEYFTNDQYHDLVDAKTLEYKIRDENSIFFEVDGPYLAMVLPASKEEGKKLKKRYAVFNFDGTLAELKGFEIKRRGELQLIKIFQSSVFEAFLKGDTLQTCYEAVAKVADYWLDVLFNKGNNLQDNELFDLISENRSMSKTLEEYGAQKSTSISTAKRLAEFLGDQMVKDKGLACKFIISKKPDGAPVSERAIPLAIFQAEDAVKRHFLRKWLKDNSQSDFDIRDILDWDYYIERLGCTIQKIITIPAALQGVENPVPRVKHPDWLRKRVAEVTDLFKQRKISDMFSVVEKPQQSEVRDRENTQDIEDLASTLDGLPKRPMVTKTKRKRSEEEDTETLIKKSWREVLGAPPPYPKSPSEIKEWVAFQRKKWTYQAQQRAISIQRRKKLCKNSSDTHIDEPVSTGIVRTGNLGTLGAFLQKSLRSLLDSPWQIIQIAEKKMPGEFKIWALVQNELHHVRLKVPRIFYANLIKPKATESHQLWKKVNRILPRSRPVYNLYKYSVPEELYLEHGHQIFMDLSDPSVEGVYETQVSLIFRAILNLGCVCNVDHRSFSYKNYKENDFFDLEQLIYQPVGKLKYLSKKNGCTIKNLYLYHHKASSGPREIFALFITPSKKALVIVVDTVKTNLMPNLNNMYNAERLVKLEQLADENLLPGADFQFEVRAENDIKKVYKMVQKALGDYKNEKKGATFVAVQSEHFQTLQNNMPELNDFPLVPFHVQDVDTLFNTLEWQKAGAKALIRHFLNSERVLELMLEQCRYYHLPLGNLPSDPTLFGTDLFYARHLQKHNFVLWYSNTDKPDLGGNEKNDARLLAESLEGSSEIANNAECYSSICFELDIDSLAINTLLQSHHVNDIEGTSTNIAFDAAPTINIENMASNTKSNVLPTYDDTALCSEAFKILRSLASVWLRDVLQFRNMFADFQIVHFYRWLRSPKSLLHDPTLLKTLQNLMKKLFMQLVAEFKRLGSMIVYANFNKIIICTKKHTIQDAITYVEYIVKNIRNKELFHSIEITYNQCWVYLLWHDLANHGGVKGKLPSNLGGVGESQIFLQSQEHNKENEDENGDQTAIVMNWNLAEYLPEEASCRESFKIILAGYINAIYTYMKNITPENIPQLPMSSQPSTQKLMGISTRGDAAKYADKILVEQLSQKLFEITERINRVIPKMTLPQLFDGKNSKMIKPALEFVKAICHVLSLDPAVEDTVSSLRRSMLKLINVGEFSEEAVWKDLSVSYVLPGIICKNCNHCRDVDLGKDYHQHVYNNKRCWFCPLCDTNYDSDEIEHLLLDIVMRKLLTYNLQDLQCKKCAQIKMENIGVNCTCAGDFRNLISKTEMTKLFRTFLNISISFRMETLQETVEWILNNTN